MMKQHFFFVFFFIISLLHSEAHFGEQHILCQSEINDPGKVITTDLNNDSHADILFTTEGKNLFWLAGNGDGTFAEKQLIEHSLLQISCLDIADFDNNGYVDIVIGSNPESKILLLLNEGEENFIESVVSSNTISELNIVHIADLDNDGDNDILSASSSYSSAQPLQWYENNGNGNFTVCHEIANNLSNIRDICTADLDGDEDLDIIYNSDSFRYLVWKSNEENGIFSQQHILNYSASSIRSIFSHDIDNDNDADIMSLSIHNDIRWYENNDNASSFSHHIVRVGLEKPLSMYPADINNDGFVDIVAHLHPENEIGWYQNDGNGDFSIFHAISKINSYTTIGGADFNEDGFIDPICSATNEDQIMWYPNNGDTTWETPQLLFEASPDPQKVFFDDFNNDSLTDFLAVFTGNQEIAWFAQNSNGQFNEKHTIHHSFKTIGQVFCCDFTGDTYPDIVYSIRNYPGDNSYSVAWQENDGFGNFDSLNIILENIDNKVKIYPSDIDNDGDNDLCIAFVGSFPSCITSVEKYENDGMGHFTMTSIIHSNLDNLTHIHAEDFDNDDDMDLLYICEGHYPDFQRFIAWHKNVGNGTFGDLHMLPGNSINVLSFGCGDMDGNDFTDILVGTRDHRVLCYHNLGEGIFDNPETISSNEYEPQDICINDVDNDGDSDILVASTGEYPDYWGKITWFENVNLSFNRYHIITTEVQNTRDICLADFDHDNDLDLFSASSLDDKVAWYENLLYVPCFNVLPANPMSLKLCNYPNPFNPTTTISFMLPEPRHISLRVFNIKGQLINTLADKLYSAGTHHVEWNAQSACGESLASGVYFYQLKYGNQTITRPMLLLK